MLSFDFQNLDIIAEFHSQEELFPYGKYHSGVRDSQKGIYYTESGINNYPILLLEDDLINQKGYGLKKGFYEVRPSLDLDFLNIIQSGEIKAKVPVITIEQIDTNPPPKEKIKAKKKKQKYKKGKSPDDYVYKKAELKYDVKNACYMLYWELNNTRMIGIMKFE